MSEGQHVSHTMRYWLLTQYGCSSSDESPMPAPADESTPQAETYPNVKFAACPFDISAASSELRCGVLKTFENYALTGADARIIEIAFGIVPATITPVATDPIVVFIGGPGASALAGFALGVEFESYSGNRDLILVDQRGAGFSVPFINCDIPDDDDFEQDDVIRSCVTEFEEQGVDLTQYRSAVIAQDFKVLRETLEIPQWNVYGESYGPIPGLLYTDLDPGGVRSVIFDSGPDNQVDIALADVAAPLDYISELAIQCAAEPDCAARFPDLRSVFIDTFRSLENDPWTGDIPGDDQFEFAGDMLFDLMQGLSAQYYPAILEIFANRNSELMLQLLFSDDGSNNDGNPGNATISDDILRRAVGANLMGAVVQCAAIDVENFGSAFIPTIEQWPDDLLTAARDRVAQNYPSICAGNFVSIEQDLSQREPRSLSVPALILAGALDPVVSLKQVKKLTKSFASPTLAITPKGGHVVGFPERTLESCNKGIVAEFLDNPADAPDTTCLDTNVKPFLFGEDLKS